MKKYLQILNIPEKQDVPEERGYDLTSKKWEPYSYALGWQQAAILKKREEVLLSFAKDMKENGSLTASPQRRKEILEKARAIEVIFDSTKRSKYEKSEQEENIEQIANDFPIKDGKPLSKLKEENQLEWNEGYNNASKEFIKKLARAKIDKPELLDEFLAKRDIEKLKAIKGIFESILKETVNEQEEQQLKQLITRVEMQLNIRQALEVYEAHLKKIDEIKVQQQETPKESPKTDEIKAQPQKTLQEPKNLPPKNNPSSTSKPDPEKAGEFKEKIEDLINKKISDPKWKLSNTFSKDKSPKEAAMLNLQNKINDLKIKYIKGSLTMEEVKGELLPSLLKAKHASSETSTKKILGEFGRLGKLIKGVAPRSDLEKELKQVYEQFLKDINHADNTPKPTSK